MTSDTASQDLEALRARIAQVEAGGLTHHESFELAALEKRIARWPDEFGNDLVAIIFGDFDPPAADVVLPDLGVTILKDKVENSIVRSAMTVLKVRVTVPSRTIEGLNDVVKRLNVLLGVYTLVEWGNSGSGWWSFVTHGTEGAAGTKIDHPEMPTALKGVLQLPGSVRRKVDAALYWIREPRSLLLEMHRKDVLRVFSAYWNAFECLVDAVGTLVPLPGLSHSEKQAAIDSRLLERYGKLTTQDIQELFNNVVNLGSVGKAIHALKVTCGVDASRYIEECFRRPDAENRLYNIRNAINHGDVDAENLLEVIRIDSRLSTLRLMVLRIFGRFVPFQYPVDTPPAAAAQLRHDDLEPNGELKFTPRSPAVE